MNGLSNAYIERTLRNASMVHFIRVFPIDRIPRNIWKNEKFVFICNLASSNIDYGHFVCIHVHLKHIYYYDSFGFKPNRAMLQILKRSNRIVKYNRTQHQGFLSQFCGFYCILSVLLYHYPNYNVQFTNNFMLNDEICIKNICTILSNAVNK